MKLFLLKYSFFCSHPKSPAAEQRLLELIEERLKGVDFSVQKDPGTAMVICPGILELIDEHPLSQNLLQMHVAAHARTADDIPPQGTEVALVMTEAYMREHPDEIDADIARVDEALASGAAYIVYAWGTIK